MMKQVGVILGAIVILLTSCLDDDSDEKRAEAEQQLNDYVSSLEARGMQVNETEEGLYYVVQDSGEGVTPDFQDLIEIGFTGRLTDGQIIQTTSADTAQKYGFYDSTVYYGDYRYYFGNGFPQGFNIGVNLMNEDARYKLIIPYFLGLGSISYSGIPAYSTLIYDIHLKKVLLEPAQYEKSLLTEYLDENNISVTDSTDSGLYFISQEMGTEDSVQTGDIVNVQYTLKDLDGAIIGQTSPGQPFQFTFGETNVIEGFEEAISMMTLEQQAKVIIPWYRAYGEFGYQTVPPYTTLIYDLQIVQLE